MWVRMNTQAGVVSGLFCVHQPPGPRVSPVSCGLGCPCRVSEQVPRERWSAPLPKTASGVLPTQHTHYTLLPYHIPQTTHYTLHRDVKALFLMALSSSKCDLKPSSFHLHLGQASPRLPVPTHTQVLKSRLPKVQDKFSVLKVETLSLEHNISYVDSGREEPVHAKP